MTNTYDRVEVAVELVRETDKAYLVHDGDTDMWIPKSQVSDLEKVTIDGKVHLAFTIPEWLALEKGLI